MSKLERLQAFISVIEQNGFAPAARALGLSTAAISRQVTLLETELNTVLLKRTTRKINLTEIGTEYYLQAKKVLSQLKDLELAIFESRNQPTGLITVTSNRYFANQFIFPRLPEFMAENPKLKVNIELAERFPDLTTENIDLIFGVSLEGHPSLVRRRVAMTRYVLCASPDYIERYGQPRYPSDLSKHQYITHSMRRPDNIILFKDNLEVYVEPTLWLNDSRAMCECAIQGMGIVNLHDYVVMEELINGRLIEILPEFCTEELPVFLYYQQSRYLQPKIRHFIDFYIT